MIGNFFKAVGKFVWNKIQQVGWAGGFNLKNAFFAYTTVVGVKGFLQAKQMLAKGQDIMANKTAAGGKIPVIYGTRRVGAQIVYMDTAQNRSKDLFVVYAISVGECEEILGRTIEIDGNSILDGNIYKGGGYVGSDKISSGSGSLNTASQVGDNQYSNAGTLGTDPTLRYSFVFNLHHGASSQTADPMLRASIPTEWTTNHKLNGICYIAASFDYDKKGMYKGVPQITVQVKGKKVYDPRTDTTAWSSNPALCFLDYIQNDEYGKGLATSQINMTTISAAANKCDTLVDQPYYNGNYQDVTWSGDSGDDFIVIDDNADWWQNKVDEVIDIRDASDTVIFDGVDIKGTTRYEFYDATQENRLYIDGTLSSSYTNEAGSAKAKVKRFHCNGYIDTNKNVMDNAKELLANMRGILNYVNGKYELQIEDTGSSTFSITDDHIIADAGISVDYGNKDKKANKVVIEFFNANKKYELDTATVLHDASPDYYSDDGEVLEIKAEFPYVTDPYIAYNMGKAILTRSRNQTTMQFLGTPEMYKLNVGDIVDLTYSGLGFSGKICRVEALELQANGLVSVSLIEYFDVYTWEVPAQESTEILAKIPTIGALKPPQANSIVFTDTDASSINRPTLTWTEPTDFPVRQYRVDVVDSSDNNVFSKIVDTPSVDLAFLPKGSNYEASITAFNGVGIESNASTKTFTIADDPVKTTEVEMNGVTMSTVETYGTVSGKSGNWVKFLNKTNFGEVVEFDNGLIVDSGTARFENAPTFVDGFTGQGTFNISQGSIQFGSYTPSTTTNNLYNVGGSLYWNGQALGTGTGDITAVVAGTNLNGGGTSGSVTLNLDSTITGDHTFSNNIIIQGNLTVQGTTTSVNTDDLNVKDKNITLNYSTGDSSASANGAGITIQDAVSATQDATLTWNTANDSFNFSHNLNFADNIKAQFGAGNDLQIYHDGSNSYVKDAGTGNLELHATNLVFKNSTGDSQYASFFNGGAVTLRYAGAPKVSTTSSGIDVTGTASATNTSSGVTTGLKLSNNTSGANNRVAIDFHTAFTKYGVIEGGYGSSSPEMNFKVGNPPAQILKLNSAGIDVTGAITTAKNDNTFTVQSTNAGQASVDIKNTEGHFRLITDAGTLKVYDQTDSSERFRIDSSGNVMLGKTSVDAGATQGFEFRADLNDLLYLARAGNAITLNRLSSDGDIALFRKNGTTVGSIGVASTDNFYIAGGSGSTKGLYFNDAGVIPATTGGGVVNNAVDLGQSGYRFKNLYLSGTAYTGGYIRGSSSDANKLILKASSSTTELHAAGGTGLVFKGNGDNERARIDSSGNLLVGKTSAGIANVGVESRQNGLLFATADGSDVLKLNRLTSDGEITQFRKDSSTVGRISTTSTGIALGTPLGSGSGIHLISNAILPSTSTGGVADGSKDLGSSSSRFKDLHLSGTAYTSKVAVNTTSPDSTVDLHVSGGTDNVPLGVESTDTNVFIALKDSTTTGTFGAAAVAIGAKGNNLLLRAGTSERARIDSSGNLLVGRTTSNTGVAGHRFSANGFANITRDGGECINFNRLTSDGTIIDLRKDSTTVGSIGTQSARLTIGTGDTGLRFVADANQITPWNLTTNGVSNGLLDLGNTNNKFKDLYLSGTAYANNINIQGSFTVDNEYTLPSTSGSAGQVLKYPSTGSQVIWADDDTEGTTINNNADNRIITGSGTANTLNAEANFTYDGSRITTTSNSALGTTFTLANTNSSGGREFTFISNSTGNFYIYDDTANTTRFTIDSAGRVGIGATSVDATLKVVSSSATTLGSWVRADNYGLRVSAGSTSSHYALRIANSSDATLATFNGDGKVGIGITSPSHKLDIAAGDIGLDSGRTLYLGSDSNVSINSTSSSRVMRFYTGGSERARIDSSGLFLVGKTSGDFGTQGSNLVGGGHFVKDGNTALYLNRLSSDGSILALYKDSSLVGSIGVGGSNKMTIIGTNANLQLGASNAALLNLNTNHLYPQTDNSVDLGFSSSANRFRNLYLTGIANVAGGIDVLNSTANAPVATFTGTYTANGDVALSEWQRSGGAVKANFAYVDSTTDMEFGTTTSHTLGIKTGNTRRLTISSGGSVGINKSVNAAVALSVGSDANSSTSYGLEVCDSSSQTRFLVDGSGSQRFYGSDNSETARFTNGKLGIGTSSPSTALHVSAPDGNAELTVARTGTYASSWSLKPYNADFFIRESGTDRVTIKAGGSVGINTTSPASPLHVNGNVQVGVGNSKEAFIQATNSGRVASNPAYSFNGDVDTGMFNPNTDNTIAFATGGSERARIDSSGNLLVGTTDSSLWNNGAGGNTGTVIESDGTIQLAKSNNATAYFNRLDSDGDIVSFRKNGSSVGSIGTVASNIYLGTGDTGIYFNASEDKIYPINTSTIAGRDNAIDLGKSDTRFKDLYLAGTANVGGVTSTGAISAEDNIYLTDAGTTRGRIELNASDRDDLDIVAVSLSSNLKFFTQNTEVGRFDASGRLGIKNTNPTATLTVGTLSSGQTGNVVINNEGGNIATLEVLSRTNRSILKIADNDTIGYMSAEGGILSIGRNSGSNAANINIDSSNNVGIGTAIPAAKLEVSGGALKVTNAGNASIFINANAVGSDASIFFEEDDGVKAKIQHDASNDSMLFTDGAFTDTMTLKGAKVGIGTTNPTESLHTTGNIRFGDSAPAELYTNSSELRLGVDRNNDNGTSNITFYVNNSETARIDSAGRFIVGGTTAGESEAATIYPSGNITSGSITATGDGVFNFNKTETYNPVITANDSESDTGQIIAVQVGGTTKGNIGINSTTGSDMYIASGTTSSAGFGLRFIDYTVTEAALPCRGDGSTADNAMDLGNSGSRFDDIYATNGTINTSDRNEKQDIQTLTEAEQRVATACKGLIRRFRWQDAVEKKGDDARYHFGVIAQDLQDAFEAEGLDAGDYGMFISSTWTDDDGNEQTRLGVRYNELLAFIITTL